MIFNITIDIKKSPNKLQCANKGKWAGGDKDAWL